MHIDDDFMEVGSLIPLKNGWFLDTETNTKFRLDEDGMPIDIHDHNESVVEFQDEFREEDPWE